MRKLILLLCFVLAVFAGCQQDKQIETPQYILQSRNEVIAIAKDEKTFDTAFAALNAGNPSLIRELIGYGDIFGVQRGTRVEVIETVGKRSKVRLMDGDIAGKVGWVQTDYLRKKCVNNRLSF